METPDEVIFCGFLWRGHLNSSRETNLKEMNSIRLNKSKNRNKTENENKSRYKNENKNKIKNKKSLSLSNSLPKQLLAIKGVG